MLYARNKNDERTTFMTSSLTPAVLLSLALVVPAAASAAVGPYVFSTSVGYSEEGNDANVDSSSLLTTLGLSRQVDRWNYAGGLTYNRRQLEFVTALKEDVRSNSLGGFVSATGNLWQGGFVALAGSYGRNENKTNDIPLYDFDANNASFTTAVTQALPLGPQFVTALTAAYTYSTFRPENKTAGFMPDTTSQGLFSAGARLVWIGARYQPFVSVAHKSFREDQIGNNDKHFYDVGLGATLPLSLGRRLQLGTSTWLGLRDFERVGVTLTYNHPIQ